MAWNSASTGSLVVFTGTAIPARSTNAVFNNAVLLVANRRLKAPARTSLMADRITQLTGERTAL